MRDGPAARLLATYLTDPGAGNKIDKGYIRHTLSVMKAQRVDVGRLVGDWTDQGRELKVAPRTADRWRSATAWSSVLSTAIMYRQGMKSEWNKYMDAPGFGPDSKAAKNYVVRLTGLVNEWKRRSGKFKSEWEEVGGDKLITNFLDVKY